MKNLHIVLSDDGHARLSLDTDETLGEEVVALTMSDGGGFSSLYTNIEDLKKINQKIADAIKEFENEKK